MFKLIEKKKNGVRIGELTTPHGKIETPFFMPVGTVGSVKGVSPDELKKLGAQIILCNTYHLYLRPGEKLIKKFGGLHEFIKWDGPILTDSGGYQVFSLAKNNLKFKISNSKSNPNNQSINDQINENCEMKNGKSLVRITEDGVEFKSHLDGSKHFFTPEKVIQIQLDLGVDILMPLDVCPSGKATKEEVKKACEITIKWAKRSKDYFDQVLGLGAQALDTTLRPKSQALRPILHGIVQGGLYPDLRKWCAEELIKLNFDGYSIGGLAVDLETRDMWEIVKLMCEILPENKQRYLMGVGTPDDILKATKLGVDMFDCVLPTRLGRHGSVYIDKCHSELVSESQQTKRSRNKFGMTKCYELVNLLNSKYREDGGVIDENCGCPACLNSHSEFISESQHKKSAQILKQVQDDTKNKIGFSCAYISHLLRSSEILGIRLTTLHNLWTYLELMRELKK